MKPAQSGFTRHCATFSGVIPDFRQSTRLDRRQAGYLRYTEYTLVSFEFDSVKSAANKAKHGIDFIEAQALWSDPDRIELPARPTNEPRFLVTGRIKHAVRTAT